MIVVSRAGKFEQSDYFDVYRLNTSKLDKADRLGPGYETWAKVINIIKNRTWDMLKTVPHVTTQYGLNKHHLFDLLVKKFGMGEQAFAKYFWPIDQHIVLADAKHEDTNIFFPSNLKEVRRIVLLHLIRRVDRYLSRKGFGYLIKKGKINFLKISSSKTLGYYDYVSRELRVDPASDNNDRVARTIAHELAHKLWYEYMSKDDHVKIDQQFWRLKSFGKTYKHDIGDVTFAVGQRLGYVGRKRTFKQNSPYMITKVETVGGKLKIYATSKNNEYSKIAGVPENFVNGNWVLDGKIIYKPEGVNKTDGWFVTAYAMTKTEEFFAELFAFYMLDLLHGEPFKWMEEILSPYRK